MIGDQPEEKVELWEENAQAVSVFRAMQTQWNVGMTGLIGMKYESLQSVPSMRNISTDEYDDVFWALQILESETLDQVRNQ